MIDKKNNKSKKSSLGIILIIEMLIINVFVVFYYQKCEFLFLSLILYLNDLTKVKSVKSM